MLFYPLYLFQYTIITISVSSSSSSGKYVKNVLPDIVFSNMKESMKLEVEPKPIFLTAKQPKPDNP
ncbi:hypothetical protein H8356DRAFT_1720907 [Neocallimastix lanati (nom. inval.)]|nr:hypothetical protein H8356DRAFT_1720907 [Neocallimastix sp. JGI-2020a]